MKTVYCRWEREWFDAASSDFTEDPLVGLIHRPNGKPLHLVSGDALESPIWGGTAGVVLGSSFVKSKLPKVMSFVSTEGS